MSFDECLYGEFLYLIGFISCGLRFHFTEYAVDRRALPYAFYVREAFIVAEVFLAFEQMPISQTDAQLSIYELDFVLPYAQKDSSAGRL